MNTKMLNRALHMPELPIGPRMVLMYLTRHCEAGTVSCSPSTKLLADETCLSRRSVVNHLGWLEGQGLIERTTQFAKIGTQLPNVYVLHLEEKAQ